MSNSSSRRRDSTIRYDAMIVGRRRRGTEKMEKEMEKEVIEGEEGREEKEEKEEKEVVKGEEWREEREMLAIMAQVEM